MASPKNWQPIYGDFTFESGLVRFHGKEVPPYDPSGRDTAPQPSVGLALCDVWFGGGRVSMDVESDHTDYVPAVQAVLFHDPATSRQLTAGFSGQFAPYNFSINEFTPPGGDSGKSGWEMLRGTGTLIRDAGRRYHLSIEQHASNIEVSVDGIVLMRHRLGSSYARTQCGIFVQSKTAVRVWNFEVQGTKRKVFVVMQFSSPFNELYTDVIQPVVNRLDLAVERADEVYGPGVIIADIEKKLTEADIVIADVTPQNENVFYELGFAHAIRKPTILIADRTKKLPFDVSPFRTLFYDNTIAGKNQVEEGLKKHLSAILDPKR